MRACLCTKEGIFRGVVARNNNETRIRQGKEYLLAPSGDRAIVVIGVSTPSAAKCFFSFKVSGLAAGLSSKAISTNSEFRMFLLII